ncbi:hypothetical protein HDU93_003677, partial [Gonapodya sp. JEL0774]
PSPLLALPPELLDLILKRANSQSQFRLGLPLALITRDNLPTFRDPEAIAERAVHRFGNPVRAFISEGRRFPAVNQLVIAAIIAIMARSDNFSHSIDLRDVSFGEWDYMLLNLKRVGMLRDIVLLLASNKIIQRLQLRTSHLILDAVFSSNDTRQLRTFIGSSPRWDEFNLFKEACIRSKNLTAAELLLDKMLESWRASELAEHPSFLSLVTDVLVVRQMPDPIVLHPYSYHQRARKRENPFVLRLTKLLIDRNLLRPSMYTYNLYPFRTLFVAACLKGCRGLVRTLLDVGVQDFGRGFELAVQYDQAGVVELLLSRTELDVASDIVTALRTSFVTPFGPYMS